MWAPGLIWLVCGFTTVCEPILGANGAPVDDCYKKTSMEKYDIHEAVCCKNHLDQGAGLSCCGKKAYNPATATCCKVANESFTTAHVTQGLSEKVSACCELKAYSPLNEICCGSTIVAKPAAKAQCCVQEAFDEDKQLCCGPKHHKKVLTRESSHHECCVHDQYNTKTHCCRAINQSNEIHLINSSYCVKKPALCHGMVYNPLSQLCCDSTIVAKPGPKVKCCGKKAFDEDKQLCCGPKHHKKVLTRESSHHECCVHSQYNTKTHCCRAINQSNKIHLINSSYCVKKPALCHGMVYNPLSQLCCDSTIVAKPGPKVKCCGKKAFDEDKQLCCGPKHHKKVLTRESSHHECCVHSQYNTKTHCCRAINQSNKIHLINSSYCVKKPALCHGMVYNPLSQLCCDSTTVAKPGPKVKCCGKKAFDEDKQLCCGPKHHKKVLTRESSHHECCVHSQYNTKTHCCRAINQSNKIHLINSSYCVKKPALCHGMVYNPLSQLCYDSTIVAKPGPKVKCCRKKAFDEDKQLCCGPKHHKKVLTRESSHHECCVHSQYNTKTHCCRAINQSNEIHLINSSYCVKKPALCHGMVYNPLSQLCCDSTIVAKPGPKVKCCGKKAFDEDKQLCCGPKHHKKVLTRESSHHECCVHSQYNTKTHCCRAINQSNEIHLINSSYCVKKPALCHGMVYNPLSQLCCDSTIVAKPGPKVKCCGKKAFDEDKQLCCGPKHHKKVLTRESSHHECCVHSQYNTKTHCCRAINQSNKIHLINSSYCVKKPALCHGMVYNPLSQLCCDSTTVAKPGPKVKCCRKKAFDEDKQLCCGPKHHKKVLTRESSHHECCVHSQYNTKTHCCRAINQSNEIHLINSSYCVKKPDAQQQYPGRHPNCTKSETSLCGSSRYHPNEFHCCKRNHARCAPGQCDAAPTVYDPRAHVRCDRRVSGWKTWMDQFHSSPGEHHCGTEVYRPDTEICCNGHRHPQVGNMHCCGVHAYDIKDQQMKCCAGTLYNLTLLGKLEHEAQCCGSILQTPQSVCCSFADQEVLYSAKTGLRCCGHLYYNTSLWSCCAGRLSPGHHQNKSIEESRLQSVNNLNETDLCKEMLIGTVESVSQDSVVFISVLKIFGRNAAVKHLPSAYILKIPDRCNFPKLIYGMTYFFDEANVYAYFNCDSIVQSLHFILSKCSCQ